MNRLLATFQRHPAPPSETVPDSLPHLRLVLDAIEEGVLLVDMEGRIRFSNAAARTLLHVGAAGVEGQRLWDVVRQPEWQRLIQEAGEGAALPPRELSVFLPEERMLRIRAISSQIPGRLVLVVLQDVTELRRLERIRQDFIANVSHELRTPLTSVRGFIETLLNGALDDTTHNRRFLQLVEEDVNRLARLTEDLLELSRAESLGKPKSLQPIDLPQLLQDVIETLAPQVRAKRLTVLVEPSGPLPPAKGDPDQLRQVCWNLLENAVKYNVEDGRVVVRLRFHKLFLYMEVEDTGIGVPAEELPRIFERFYRVDKARSRALGGTGLGLSIVKHIVEAHGGTVSVESEFGRGSAFRVSLPVWQP